jgi:hypothetical protein
METDPQEEMIWQTPASRAAERETLNAQIEEFFANGGKVTEGGKLVSEVSEIEPAIKAKMVKKSLPDLARKRLSDVAAYQQRVRKNG